MNVADAIKKMAAQSNAALTANQLRVVVALERAVARLESEPKLHEHLVFKGGFVLLKTIESPRFTRDLDALALDIDQEVASKLAIKALERDLEDGLWFVDPQIENIPDQGEYGGLRVNCAFQIGTEPPLAAKIKKLSRVHIDIAFGDKVPKAAWTKPVEMASAVGELPVSWHIYPLEFIFAEKLQTLLVRGSANSRAKDVYDLVEIFPHCKDSGALSRAIQDVFRNRGTSMPRSLAETVMQFDQSVLVGAWGSVIVGKRAPRFEDYWNQLLEVLRTLGETHSSI